MAARPKFGLRVMVIEERLAEALEEEADALIRDLNWAIEGSYPIDLDLLGHAAYLIHELVQVLDSTLEVEIDTGPLEEAVRDL